MADVDDVAGFWEPHIHIHCPVVHPSGHRLGCFSAKKCQDLVRFADRCTTNHPPPLLPLTALNMAMLVAVCSIYVNVIYVGEPITHGAGALGKYRKANCEFI